MNKKFYYICLSFFILACGQTKKEVVSEEVTSAEETLIIVSNDQFSLGQMEVGTLQEAIFPKKIAANGYLDVPPQNRASIRTFMGGYIKNSPLLVGDKVRKGQMVVTLENTEFVTLQQEYMEITEELTFLKSEFERQRALIAENITSQKNFLKAESDYKKAIALQQGLSKKLELLSINPSTVAQGNFTSLISLRSPIEGNVTSVSVSNGTYVSPSDEIMELMDVSHMHVELQVFEKDILQLKKGQHISFRVPEAGNEMYDADVYLVGTSVDGKTRTITIHGHLREEDKVHFAAGMFVEAEVFISERKALALPASAVIDVDGIHWVLVQKEQSSKGYSFEKMEVQVGERTENWVEITSSIPEGTIFLRVGANEMISGDDTGGHDH